MCDCWFTYDEDVQLWRCDCCKNAVSDKSASDLNKEKFRSRGEFVDREIDRRIRIHRAEVLSAITSILVN